MKAIMQVLGCILILISPIYSQGKFSLQMDGGIISPFSASNGLSINLQANYSINSTFNLYLYSGVSKWNKNKIVFWDYGKTNPYSYIVIRNFNSYSEDNHLLIPFYFGGSFNLHINKILTPFLIVEIGYSYLGFYSYENSKVVNPENGITEYYYPDKSTRKYNREDLFGTGVGGGLSLPVSRTINLIALIKLNSFVNNKYNGLFSRNGMYITFTAGLNYHL